MARVVSVINFKGGVGKTTLALHFATWLAQRGSKGQKVLLIDVDHQSSLSIICLDPEAWEQAARENRTGNRIFSSFMGGTLPGQEIVAKQPFGALYPNLDILPAQLELDDTEIELAATTIGNPIHSEWRKRTLLCKWLETSGAASEYDYVVIDCPPATKLVSQNALAASHWYVLPVIPEAVSSRGVTHFRNLVTSSIDRRLGSLAANVPASQACSSFVPETRFGGIVVSQARPHGPASSGYIAEHTQQMGELRNLWGRDVLNNVIDRYTGVAESLAAGWPVFNQPDNPNVTNQGLPRMFAKVCNELALRLGW